MMRRFSRTSGDLEDVGEGGDLTGDLISELLTPGELQDTSCLINNGQSHGRSFTQPRQASASECVCVCVRVCVRGSCPNKCRHFIESATLNSVTPTCGVFPSRKNMTKQWREIRKQEKTQTSTMQQLVCRADF